MTVLTCLQMTILSMSELELLQTLCELLCVAKAFLK